MMVMAEGRVWEPTAELRWTAATSASPKRLQRKWIEHFLTDVVINARQVTGGPTGNVKWLDVPAVMEGIETRRL
jgi:hypothetical protein